MFKDNLNPNDIADLSEEERTNQAKTDLECLTLCIRNCVDFNYFQRMKR